MEKKTLRKYQVVAGMKFTYPGTEKDKLREVGYMIKEFTYKIYPDGDEQLINEKIIKQVLFGN